MLLDVSPTESYKVRGLFIENAPIYRRWVTELVSSKIDFVEIEDFEAALSYLRDINHIDFILIDWEMLSAVGLEVLQKIREASPKPIILLAGRELSKDELQRTMQSGVVDLLQKSDIQKRCESLEESRPYLKLDHLPSITRFMVDAAASGVGEELKSSLRSLDFILAKLKE